MTLDVNTRMPSVAQCDWPDRPPPPQRRSPEWLQWARGMLVYLDRDYSFATRWFQSLDKETQAMVNSQIVEQADVNTVHPMAKWQRNPDALPREQEVSVGALRPGERFRSDNLDGSWTYGTLVESRAEPVFRARVRLDGGQRHVVFGEGDKRREFESTGASTVNWPYTVQVERVKEGSGAAAQDPQERGEHTMNATAQEKAVQARYTHQLKQLAVAKTAGDATKVEMVQKKVNQIVAEAETLGLKLQEELTSDTEANKAGATQAQEAPHSKAAKPKVVTVGKGKVEVKEQTETPQSKADQLKVANAARLAALREKKTVQGAVVKAKREAKPKLDSTRDCLCGCGTETGGRFAPGHDARVKGLLLKVERGEEKADSLAESLKPYVKFAGKSATAGNETSDYKLVKAPVKFPGRPDIAYVETL